MFSLTPTPRYAVAGVRRVLVAAFAPGTRFVFGAPLADGLPVDLLTELQPAPTWHRFSVSDTATATQNGARTLNGERYEQKLTLPFVTGLSRLQRHVLSMLFKQPVWTLIEDMAGNWWLGGKDRGMSCKGLGFTTGARNGEVLATATLEGAEPAAWYPFAPGAALTLSAAAPASPSGSDVFEEDYAEAPADE